MACACKTEDGITWTWISASQFLLSLNNISCLHFVSKDFVSYDASLLSTECSPFDWDLKNTDYIALTIDNNTH